MADQIKLTAAVRETTGKGAAKRMRREGKVPAVIYGQDRPTRSLTVEATELYHALHTSAGMNVLVNLKAGDVEQLAMPKSVQRHPVRGDYMHIDFVRIDTDIDINVEIPVHTVGDEDVRPGVVSVTLPSLPVVCKPLNVPDSITIDVSGLTIGDSIHAGEVVLPEGVLLDIEEERTVVTVTAPTIELEETDEEAGEFAGEAVEGEDGEAVEGEAGESGEAAADGDAE